MQHSPLPQHMQHHTHMAHQAPQTTPRPAAHRGQATEADTPYSPIHNCTPAAAATGEPLQHHPCFSALPLSASPGARRRRPRTGGRDRLHPRPGAHERMEWARHSVGAGCGRISERAKAQIERGHSVGRAKSKREQRLLLVPCCPSLRCNHLALCHVLVQHQQW